MMKKSIIALALGVMIASSGAAIAQQGGLLIVDVNQVVRDSVAVKAAQPQIQARAKQLEDRRNGYQAQFSKEANDLQDQARSGVATEDVLRPKQQDLQKRAAAAEDELKRQATELQRIDRYVLEQIVDEVDKISAEIQKTRGAVAVLRAEATISHTESMDITKQVLQMLNQRKPTVSLTPPAPAAAPQAQATTPPKKN